MRRKGEKRFVAASATVEQRTRGHSWQVILSLLKGVQFTRVLPSSPSLSLFFTLNSIHLYLASAPRVQSLSLQLLSKLKREREGDLFNVRQEAKTGRCYRAKGKAKETRYITVCTSMSLLNCAVSGGKRHFSISQGAL